MEYRLDFAPEILQLLEVTARARGCNVESIVGDALILWCRSQPEYRQWWARHRYCMEIDCEHFPSKTLPGADGTPEPGTQGASSAVSRLNLAQQLEQSIATIREVREGTGAQRQAQKRGN